MTGDEDQKRGGGSINRMCRPRPSPSRCRQNQRSNRTSTTMTGKRNAPKTTESRSKRGRAGSLSLSRFLSLSLSLSPSPLESYISREKRHRAGGAEQEPVGARQLAAYFSGAEQRSH